MILLAAGEPVSDAVSGLWAALSIAASLLFALVLLFALWMEHRRRQRAEAARSALLLQLSSASAEGARAVLDLMQAEARQRAHGLLEQAKLGGLICIALGFGLTALLAALTGGALVFLCGLLPALLGAAMLVYVYRLAKPLP